MMRRWLRPLLLLILILLLLWEGSTLVALLTGWLENSLERWGGLGVVLAALAYAVLLSIPFVPGVELGWALMLLLGPPGVVIAYLGTIAGLSLSFLIGHVLSLRCMSDLLGWLRMDGAHRFCRRLNALEPEQRLELLLERAPNRWVPVLLRKRYLALGLAFNLPGNTVVGGGGGIGMVAGMSRLFVLPGYVLVLALATLPVPLAVLAYQLFSAA